MENPVTYAKPLVSIILVAYAGDSKYFSRAISSIMAQTLDPTMMELIIGFDGPLDQISENYLVDACMGAKFPIRVFWNPEKTGYYTVPRNRMTPLASGFYVYNMDVDNEIAPEHLTGLLHAIRTPHPTEGWPHFVYSRRRYLPDPDYRRKASAVIEGDSPFMEWTPENVGSLTIGPMHNFVDTGDMLIGKSVLYELAERTGYIWNSELRRFGDWDLVARLAKTGMRGRAVDQITNLYHVTGENVSLTRKLSDIVVIPQSLHDELKARGQVID